MYKTRQSLSSTELERDKTHKEAKIQGRVKSEPCRHSMNDGCYGHSPCHTCPAWGAGDAPTQPRLVGSERGPDSDGPIGRVTPVQHAELGHHVTALGTGIETPKKEVLVSCRHCTESWSFGGLCWGAGAGGCGKSGMWEQKWRKQRKLRSG